MSTTHVSVNCMQSLACLCSGRWQSQPNLLQALPLTSFIRSCFLPIQTPGGGQRDRTSLSNLAGVLRVKTPRHSQGYTRRSLKSREEAMLGGSMAASSHRHGETATGRRPRRDSRLKKARTAATLDPASRPGPWSSDCVAGGPCFTTTEGSSHEVTRLSRMLIKNGIGRIEIVPRPRRIDAS